MKRKMSVITAVLLAMTQAATAQNSLSVADFELPQSGGEMTVNFTLAEADVYTSYQFKVVTPDGIVYVMDSDNDVECDLGTGHDATHMSTAHWNADIKTLTIGVASMKSALLKGQEGSLTIPVAATEAAVGTQLDFTITGITFIRQTGEKDEIDDVTFTVTIGEPDDGRMKFDENATKLPAYTVGDKANITMKRTIKAGEWSTLVLPFNLTKANATAVFGSDVQFAKFDGFVVDYGDDEENVVPLGITINLTNYSIPARGNLTGGTPVLIKTSEDISEIQLDDVTLVGTVTDVEKADEYETPGKLTGTLVKTTIPEDGLFINSNKFWYSTGNTNVKAFRCWFELGAVLDKETDFGARVQMVFSSEETGVSEIVNRKSSNSKCYDLQGRRVANPGKGVFVKDGKKVIIK